MMWEKGIETCKLSYVKRIASPGSMHDTGHSGLVHWDDPGRGMGWGGRWEEGSVWGTHVNPWLIHINVWQRPLQYCKVISLQLIQINEEKKKTTKIKLISEIL